MVETSRPPSLSSTNETDPYVPISTVAVAAFASAALFVLSMLVLAYDSLAKKRPLIEPELVTVFVLVTLVLSFIGRRIVRNSEGTRTGKALGLDLTNTAWWTAVVLGLAYGAYGLAVALPVYWDAKTEVNKWIDNLGRGDVAVAFHQTIPPGGRGSIATADLATMEARYPDDFIRFRQSRLVRTALRNKGECRFEPVGLREWSFQPQGLNCNIAGVLVCPEGRFPIVVPLKATEQRSGDREKVSTGRQWQVLPDQGGYVKGAELTPYGWAIGTVMAQGEAQSRSFLRLQSLGAAAQRDAFVAFVENRDPAQDPLFNGFAAVGGWGIRMTFPSSLLDASSDRLFTNENGAAPTPAQRDKFRLMWRTMPILPPGYRLKDSPDQGEALTWTDAGLELRVPVELPMPAPGGEPSAARGRLVLGCNDPALLARLKELKAASSSDKTTEKPPENLALPPSAWRVLRVESNLKPVATAPPQPPAGGMGM